MRRRPSLLIAMGASLAPPIAAEVVVVPKLSVEDQAQTTLASWHSVRGLLPGWLAHAYRSMHTVVVQA
jgi:hypothetical protein